MTTRLSAGIMACLLVLTGCSTEDGGTSDVSDETFCAAIEDWFTILFEADAAMTPIQPPSGDIENPGDPGDLPTADDLHTAASQVLAKAQEADDLLPTILANISQPLVADDFEGGHNLTIELLTLNAEIAGNADSYLDYTADLMANLDRFADLSASLSVLDSFALDYYIETTCPEFYDSFYHQSGAAYDTDAMSDVAALGKEIATYYVDHIEPAPVITVEDGVYYLLDTPIGNVSEGNRITDQYYEGYTDWCVEITNDDGELKIFSYSAQRGLENETCR